MIARPRKLQAVVISLVSLLALALALVPVAAAGKSPGGGHKGGSGSLSLVVVSSPSNDNLAHWGGQISFNVSTTATTQPNVSVTCTQNGAVVYGAQTGYYAGYPWPWTQTMTLSSQSWTGGSAACVANLYYFSGTSTINLGSMTFTALA